MGGIVDFFEKEDVRCRQGSWSAQRGNVRSKGSTTVGADPMSHDTAHATFLVSEGIRLLFEEVEIAIVDCCRANGMPP